MASDDLLAAMYQAEEEPEQPVREVNRTFPDRGIASMPAITAEMRKMKREMDEMTRTIRRLENRLKYMERKANVHTSDVTDIRRELDGKMDRF